MTPTSLIEWLGALDLEVIVIVFVLPAMALGALGAVVVRWLAGDLVDPASQVVPAKVAFVAEIYSVLLGLLVMAAYAEYMETRMHVLAEAATLDLIVGTAAGLEDELRAPLAAAVRGYTEAVVAQEWPSPAAEGSPAVDAAERALLVGSTVPAGDGAVGTALTLARAQALAAEIRLHRVARLAAAPDPQVARLLSGAVLVASFLALGVGWFLRGPSLLLHMILSAALVGLFLTLIVTAVELIYPFSGSIAISPDPYRRLLAGA